MVLTGNSENEKHTRYLCYRYFKSDEGGMEAGTCPHPEEH